MGCLGWQQCVDQNGYGKVKIDGINYLAHRVAYVNHIGIPVSALNGTVMHTCDNPTCVNPWHLRLGTPADNSADMVSKGRQARGSRQGAAKLSSEDVLSIRSQYTPGSGYSLARKFGVSRALIGKIIRKEVWSWI